MKPHIKNLKRLFTVLLLVLCRLPAIMACDSSMLEILTGKSTQKELTVKMLAVSQKMQQTGSLLKAFNNSAARKLHREIMENWLNITSIIPSLPAKDTGETAGSDLTIRISRDLGQIRRQLEDNNFANIHELIEACITRISLVCAIFNDHHAIRSFLAIELEIFQLRPLTSDHQSLQNLVKSSRLQGLLDKFASENAIASTPLIKNISEAFNSFKTIVETGISPVQSSVTTALQTLVNSFIALKQHLLSTDFFKKS